MEKQDSLRDLAHGHMDEEYLKILLNTEFGLKCPYCGSNNLYYYDIRLTCDWTEGSSGAVKKSHILGNIEFLCDECHSNTLWTPSNHVLRGRGK